MRTPRTRARIFVGLTIFALTVWFAVTGQTTSAASGLLAASTLDTATTLPCGSVPDEFSDPNGGRPWEISAGADGNLWFTHNSSNKIGQITPLGIVTEFPLSSSSST